MDDDHEELDYDEDAYDSCCHGNSHNPADLHSTMNAIMTKMVLDKEEGEILDSEDKLEASIVEGSTEMGSTNPKAEIELQLASPSLLAAAAAQSNRWDQAHVSAKERFERAKKRRQEDKDFDEKRMNLKMKVGSTVFGRPQLAPSQTDCADSDDRTEDWIMQELNRPRTCSRCSSISCDQCLSCNDNISTSSYEQKQERRTSCERQSQRKRKCSSEQSSPSSESSSSSCCCSQSTSSTSSCSTCDSNRRSSSRTSYSKVTSNSKRRRINRKRNNYKTQKNDDFKSKMNREQQNGFSTDESAERRYEEIMMRRELLIKEKKKLEKELVEINFRIAEKRRASHRRRRR